MSTRNVRHLHMATDNAAAFWTALATSRGHQIVRRDSFLAAISGTRIGNRVLLLSSSPSTDDIQEIRRLVTDHSAIATVVEDPFSTVEVLGLGLEQRPMPVMARMPRRVELTSEWRVRTVESVDDLRLAEQVIVHGFPLARAQPYEPGEVLPEALLAYPGFTTFLIGRDETVGACVTMTAAAAAGVYWVTTLPAARSQGVARALMVAVMNHHGELPMTLDASIAGKPLYDSLGFAVVADSTWWT